MGGGQGAALTSPLGPGDRWEELHTLASEPKEQHVLTAEQAEDATNGLLSTLSKAAVCTVASPGKAFQAGKEGSCPWCKWGGDGSPRPEVKRLPRKVEGKRNGV